MPEREGSMPRKDPFVGRLVRFTSGLSLPVSARGPLMLCVVGWDNTDWRARLATLTDGLVPGSLRQLSISSQSLQDIMFEQQLPQLQDFLRRHGASVDCLHLGDQDTGYDTATPQMFRFVIPFLPNLVTLRVGLKYGKCKGVFGGEWEELAALFVFLDKHCPALQHLHIWHDVIFWNDPATFRWHQRSSHDQGEWCMDELELTLAEVCAAIRRVFGRLTSLDNLPPGLAAFLLGDEGAEATTAVDKDRTHANFKLSPKITVTASDPKSAKGNHSGRTDKAATAVCEAADISEDKINALFEAVERGSLDEVRELVETQGVPISIKNACSRSPLYTATLLGHGPVVKFLLQHHAEDNGSAFLAGNVEMRQLFSSHGYSKTGKLSLLERCNAMRSPIDLYKFLLKNRLDNEVSDEVVSTPDTLTNSERLDQWRRVIFMALLGAVSCVPWGTGIDEVMRNVANIAPESIHTRADWRSIVDVADKALPCPAYPKTIAILRSQNPGYYESIMWKALAGCLRNAPHDVIGVRLEPVLEPTSIPRALENAVAVTLHKGVPEPFCYIDNKGQSGAAGPQDSGCSTVDYSVPGKDASPFAC